MTTYPKEFSRVSVTFKDTGEVKEYEISAGPGISRYLCEQAAATGFLTFMSGPRAVNIPVGQVLVWEMERIGLVEEREPHTEGAA